MEFSDLGHRCEYDGCNIHDYLPFYCTSCQKYYCLEHKDYSIHECINNPLVKNTIKTPKKKGKRVKYRCSYKGCKTCNQVAINCQKCHKNFCLKHRFPEDHSCQLV